MCNFCEFIVNSYCQSCVLLIDGCHSFRSIALRTTIPSVFCCYCCCCSSIHSPSHRHRHRSGSHFRKETQRENWSSSLSINAYTLVIPFILWRIYTRIYHIQFVFVANNSSILCMSLCQFDTSDRITSRCQCVGWMGFFFAFFSRSFFCVLR